MLQKSALFLVVTLGYFGLVAVLSPAVRSQTAGATPTDVRVVNPSSAPVQSKIVNQSSAPVPAKIINQSNAPIPAKIVNPSAAPVPAKIINTSSTPVPVTGSIGLNTSSANPAHVRTENTGPLADGAVMGAVFSAANNLYIRDNLYTAPAGKRFVSQHFSAQVRLPPADKLTSLYLLIRNSAGGLVAFHFMPVPQGISNTDAGEEYFNISQPIRFPLEPGWRVAVEATRDSTTSGAGSLNMSLTGYLVDAN